MLLQKQRGSEGIFVEMNYLLQTVVFLFGCVGMTQIIVESSISLKIKNLIKTWSPAFLRPVSGFFLELTGCYQCTGFWVGIIVGCVFFIPGAQTYFDYAKIFVSGCASSCLSLAWTTLLMYLESQTVIKT